ncbi:zinc finger FYVE domain-containing protein 16 [Cyprinodon tularosa]|uniref:zinc finger FYVE domain-containing protein 16 n=1 Tax=Cyprinodon tularosa TaxID=77115 RepID=UPI0018E2332D|nr:zinc finger FYVE domain-containing protein 16 [Cyprinodon tularosa]
MDSFFKAAVCDLDKVLDDFELNSEEAECQPVFLKPPAYPFCPDVPSGPTSLPDLNSLHYGSAGSCSDASNGQQTADVGEVRGQPLTAVDLLSSVDRRPAKNAAPPCPDRTLKPVCDLVNDASSAILVRTNSQEEEEEALLVDFDSPAVTEVGVGLNINSVEEEQTELSCHQQSGGYSASLSLLDIIFPAAAEKSSEPSDQSELADADEKESEEQLEGASSDRHKAESDNEVTSLSKEQPSDQAAEGESDEGIECESSNGEPGSLSCLPLAVSICGALVNSTTSEDPPGAAEASESTGGKDDGRDGSSDSEQMSERRPSPEGQHASLGSAPAEPDPPYAPEFGFEYLPESDQAELLVTDEELDAFLQAHAEAEQGAGPSLCSRGSGDEPQCLSESGQVLEERRDEPEPGSCGQEQEEPEALSSADATSAASAERSFSPPALSASGESIPLQCHDSYGGARPKQPHSQTARPPPAGEEGTEPSTSPTPEEQEHPAPTEDPSKFRDSDLSSPPYQQDFSAGFDELSEPPPYPGEEPLGAARPANWKGDGEEELGSIQPAWVPDAEAPSCMKCHQTFTFIKRRHHCRACGKVYCAGCCNRKCKLKYLDKEARVCVLCFDTIHKAQALERMMSPTGPSPNPNIPSEYCSTIPPLQQARAAGTLNSPPPTVMVPVSVLKQPNNDACPREQKRVWFADGILPNGEVADTARLSVTSQRSSQDFSPDPETPGSAGSDPGGDEPSGSEAPGAAPVERAPVSGPWDYGLLSGIGSSVSRIASLLPDNEDELPPLLITTGEDDGEDVLVEESPAPCQIRHLLEEGGPRPLTFVLNANLLINVKLVTYGSRQCWCFGSNGLQALGQKELVFLLECLSGEKTLPRDLFSLYLTIYQDAQKGKFVEELDNVTFTSSFLDSKDHAGMLFFAPTCQPLDGLTLPPQPFLFGLLVQKLEVPWAKVFPLRLLLRLGAEYDMYPTTLISVRFRESVYRETGHTIMNLLADLRNYQYSLSVVEGLRIHMEMGHSYIEIPKASFSEMQKVVNSSNEHVISIGASFSQEADSHLVCFQNEEGNYQTQANSKPGETRTVTGASFVVFNGALKASSGFIAKSSIVEDGLMVQIPRETMESLRSALREQTDFDIPCGKNDGGEVKENVTVRWVDWTSPVNSGKTSGVDGRPLDGVPSVRMEQDTEFESHSRTIRCTEVFYQLKSPDCSLAAVLSSCSGFQKEIALATCSALAPHLSVLTSSGINSLWLRVSTQADMLEYQAGSGGRLLPQRYMNEMDGALIPVIHGGGASVPQTAMDMELVFYITHSLQ